MIIQLVSLLETYNQRSFILVLKSILACKSMVEYLCLLGGCDGPEKGLCRCQTVICFRDSRVCLSQLLLIVVNCKYDVWRTY